MIKCMYHTSDPRYPKSMSDTHVTRYGRFKHVDMRYYKYVTF